MKKLNIYAFADEASSNVDEQIVAMKRNGLQGLEIRSVDGENVSVISEEKAKEVRRKLDDAGLITWSIGSPIGKIDIENDDYAAHLETLKHTLEVANILGSENLRFFSFYIPQGKDPFDYENEVLDRMGQMAEISIKAGVNPCHENEKGIFGDNAERCLKIHEQLPLVQGIFDPANFVQCGVDTAKAWKMLNPYIKYLHIKDALADGSVVPAGKGIGNVAEIVSDYRTFGDAVTIEPHLTIFDGLKALERAGEETKTGKYEYPDANTAFDAACNALKALL